MELSPELFLPAPEDEGAEDPGEEGWAKVVSVTGLTVLERPVVMPGEMRAFLAPFPPVLEPAGEEGGEEGEVEGGEEGGGGGGGGRGGGGGGGGGEEEEEEEEGAATDGGGRVGAGLRRPHQGRGGGSGVRGPRPAPIRSGQGSRGQGRAPRGGCAAGLQGREVLHTARALDAHGRAGAILPPLSLSPPQPAPLPPRAPPPRPAPRAPRAPHAARGTRQDWTAFLFLEAMDALLWARIHPDAKGTLRERSPPPPPLPLSY